MFKKILFIIGTRPEVIKTAPLILHLKTNYKELDVTICATYQHKELLDQAFDFFELTPDFKLDIMKQNQSLFHITAKALTGLEKIINDFKPDLLIVQGDTTSAFCGALAGYYNKIKVAHIEAGLRSNNKYAPFPEEINRSIIARIADYHFAPTIVAKNNLKNEDITKNVYVTGNTVIDALFLTLQKIKNNKNYYNKFNDIDFSKKIILVTAHRRENLGEPLKNICYALNDIVNNYTDVQIIFPLHPNPKIREIVSPILNTHNIFIIPPLSYDELIWLMDKSYLILTDSGGIQEEAPSLNKPVLVMRETTERMEGIISNCAKLVGTDRDLIFKETSRLIYDKKEYKKYMENQNPYGDGKASIKIAEILFKD